jgi:hypothetical protein
MDCLQPSKQDWIQVTKKNKKGRRGRNSLIIPGPGREISQQHRLVPPTDEVKRGEIRQALRDLCIALRIGVRESRGYGPVRVILGLTTRRVSQLETVGNGNEVQTELDSHADTCVLGKNVLIIIDH